jgi:phosphoglycolate phosphatase
MAAVKLVAFDLDGTLVDSAADIARAVDCMTRDLGLPPPDINMVRSWVGDGVRMLLKRALGAGRDSEPPAELYQKALSAFRRAYHQSLASESRLYPGALETLNYLYQRNFALACITNKSAEFTRPLLQALAIDSYFGVVVSGDSLPQRKPSPEPLLHTARHFGISPDRAVMVGDSRNDLMAARAANFMAIGVRYGYGGDLSGFDADALLDSLTELPPLLTQTSLEHASKASG